jgi:hypothetical protein
MIVGDATTWSVTYDHQYDESWGVIYDHNIFTIQATTDKWQLGATYIKHISFSYKSQSW